MTTLCAHLRLHIYDAYRTPPPPPPPPPATTLAGQIFPSSAEKKTGKRKTASAAGGVYPYGLVNHPHGFPLNTAAIQTANAIARSALAAAVLSSRTNRGKLPPRPHASAGSSSSSRRSSSFSVRKSVGIGSGAGTARGSITAVNPGANIVKRRDSIGNPQVLLPARKPAQFQVEIVRGGMNKSYGFGLGTAADGEKAITTVRGGGVSANLLEVGDVLCEIEGVDARTMSHAEAIQALTSSTTLRIVVQRRFADESITQISRRAPISTVDTPAPEDGKSTRAREARESRGATKKSKGSQVLVDVKYAVAGSEGVLLTAKGHGLKLLGDEEKKSSGAASVTAPALSPINCSQCCARCFYVGGVLACASDASAAGSQEKKATGVVPVAGSAATAHPSASADDDKAKAAARKTKATARKRKQREKQLKVFTDKHGEEVGLQMYKLARAEANKKERRKRARTSRGRGGRGQGGGRGRGRGSNGSN